MAGRAAPDPPARVGDGLKVTEPSKGAAMVMDGASVTEPPSKRGSSGAPPLNRRSAPATRMYASKCCGDRGGTAPGARGARPPPTVSGRAGFPPQSPAERAECSRAMSSSFARQPAGPARTPGRWGNQEGGGRRAPDARAGRSAHRERGGDGVTRGVARTPPRSGTPVRQAFDGSGDMFNYNLVRAYVGVSICRYPASGSPARCMRWTPGDTYVRIRRYSRGGR